MKNKFKITLIKVRVSICIFCGCLCLFGCIHHIELKDYKRYLWVFNDTAQKNIDTLFFEGRVSEYDAQYHYIYKKSYYITVWEFINLHNVELKNIHINNNIDLKDVKIVIGEGTNKDSKNVPFIKMKPNYTINKVFNVNIGINSKINKYIDSTNYKGFFGEINKMTFSSESGEHLIIFEYKKLQQTLFLLCKRSSRFYVVIINSEKHFDENIIEILDLQ